MDSAIEVSPASSSFSVPRGMALATRDLPHPAARLPRLIDWHGVQFYAFQENNRLYPPWLDGKYPWPCDVQERDRCNIILGIIHRFVLDQRGINGEDNFSQVTAAPVAPVHPSRVLDLKSDSGLWCDDMATRFPNAHIVGYGIVGGQFSLKPNVNFIVPQQGNAHPAHNFDYNDPHWSLPAQSFNLIHASQLLGYIDDWPAFYRKCFSHLSENGYIEHFEIDWEPKSATGILPPDSPPRQWHHYINQALRMQGRSFSLSADTADILDGLGFDDITHRTHRLAASTWCRDRKQRDIAEWFFYLIEDFRLFESLALAPLTRYLGWSVDDVRRLHADCLRCVRSKEFQMYFTLHIWTARKPAPTLSTQIEARM